MPTGWKIVVEILPASSNKSLCLVKFFPGKNNEGENLFYNLHEKSDAKFFFMVAVRDIKAGDELTANYNLYTYPKTGVGLQMI